MKAGIPKNHDPTMDTKDYSDAEYNPRLHYLILEVIENQLRDNDSPETRLTLERMIANGDSEEEAKRKIGSVLVTHIYSIIKDQGHYENELYCRGLMKLK